MGIIGLIWTIIVGLIVGILARWLYPGSVAMTWWLTAALGIAGSIVGGLISALLFRSGRFSPAGILMSVIGALLLLWAYMKFFAR